MKLRMIIASIVLISTLIPAVVFGVLLWVEPDPPSSPQARASGSRDPSPSPSNSAVQSKQQFGLFDPVRVSGAWGKFTSLLLIVNGLTVVAITAIVGFLTKQIEAEANRKLEGLKAELQKENAVYIERLKQELQTETSGAAARNAALSLLSKSGGMLFNAMQEMERGVIDSAQISKSWSELESALDSSVPLLSQDEQQRWYSFRQAVNNVFERGIQSPDFASIASAVGRDKESVKQLWSQYARDLSDRLTSARTPSIAH